MEQEKCLEVIFLLNALLRPTLLHTMLGFPVRCSTNSLRPSSFTKATRSQSSHLLRWSTFMASLKNSKRLLPNLWYIYKSNCRPCKAPLLTKTECEVRKCNCLKNHGTWDIHVKRIKNFLVFNPLSNPFQMRPRISIRGCVTLKEGW